MPEVKKLPRRIQRCAICENDVSGSYWGPEKDSWGHSAWPVVNDGRCCEFCNWMVVIPARLRSIAAADTK